MLLVIVLLCCATLCFGALAANPPAKALGLNQLKQSNTGLSAPLANPQAKAASTPAPAPRENITVLKQDSGMNLSKMNITLSVSPTYGSAQTVKFNAPKPGWKLEHVLVMATDGWNASIKQLPRLLPFAIEIRDANLRLLYHFSDTQLAYFTSPTEIRMANVEIPAMPMNETFFVCFYGYRSLALAAEPHNATGNSYYFDKLTGELFPGVMPTINNQSIPVNWLIRVAGR